VRVITPGQFESRDIAPFTSPRCGNPWDPTNSSGCYTPETALNFFSSHAAQHSNSQVWFQLDDLPWAPEYTFNEAKTEVTLNTTLNDEYWPQVLAMTKSTNFRMPFSLRIFKAEGARPHLFPDNCTWWFTSHDGHTKLEVPIFTAPFGGILNPEFERMFKILFKATMQYLESKGWADSGSWVQVTDEPIWTDNATLANSIAMMRLYKSVDPRIKVYQTRFPQGGGSSAADVGSRSLAAATRAVVLPGTEPLLDLVDWWCPHVCQWTTPGVSQIMTALRAKKEAHNKPFHITVYDNGVPIIESPWERLRTQPLDAFISNGTLDGTLSWYSVDSYARGEHAAVADPWTHPYPTSTVTTLKNGSTKSVLRDPAGWGYLLYPPPPKARTGNSWSPVESVRWVMTGAGIQDAEYLYALQKASPLSAKAAALLAQARTLATHFPLGWNPGCTGGGKVLPDGSRVADWGDDGYAVDKGGQADGSSVVNEWRLALGEELDKAAARGAWDEQPEQPSPQYKSDDDDSMTWHGPQVRIVHGDGLPSFSITNPKTNSNERLPLLYLVGGLPSLMGLKEFDGAEARMHREMAVAASKGVRIVCAGLSYTGYASKPEILPDGTLSAETMPFLRRLMASAPRLLLMLRIRLDLKAPAVNGSRPGSVVMQSLLNSSKTAVDWTSSPTRAWAAQLGKLTSKVMQTIDAAFPGKLLGAQILHGITYEGAYFLRLESLVTFD
jgi:hypothetical protein